MWWLCMPVCAVGLGSSADPHRLPIPKQPSGFLEFYVMPFNHLVYAVTWCVGLAGCTRVVCLKVVR